MRRLSFPRGGLQDCSCTTLVSIAILSMFSSVGATAVFAVAGAKLRRIFETAKLLRKFFFAAAFPKAPPGIAAPRIRSGSVPRPEGLSAPPPRPAPQKRVQRYALFRYPPNVLMDFCTKMPKQPVI